MPRKKPKHETLMMKWRARALRRMTKSELTKKVERAVRTGTVPNDIELVEMNWAKGSARTFREGVIDGDDWASLQKFHGAMQASSFRVERPD